LEIFPASVARKKRSELRGKNPRISLRSIRATVWLPAPKGEFVAMMRMYAPQQKSPSVIDGSWSPPPVVKME
jgi:hypothetical protein